MGGEKACLHYRRGASAGSPPRGRGKAQSAYSGYNGIRITPAWAGKSFCPADPAVPPADHPRVGGEKAGIHLTGGDRVGSPPRGRGKANLLFYKVNGFGITPAWAGKRPPKRGFKRRMGITPAWAGKRQRQSATIQPNGDHPRVGGEKRNITSIAAMGSGSPPRGRGKVDADSEYLDEDRITPAWAGKRSKNYRNTATDKDHPRVGGEKTSKNRVVQGVLGSPPRGRGKASIGQ